RAGDLVETSVWKRRAGGSGARGCCQHRRRVATAISRGDRWNLWQARDADQASPGMDGELGAELGSRVRGAGAGGRAGAIEEHARSNGGRQGQGSEGQGSGVERVKGWMQAERSEHGSAGS